MFEFSSIFEREWTCALHISQLPDVGSYQTFEIDDKPILLVRSAEGSIRAFYNVCFQRGRTLVNGFGAGALAIFAISARDAICVDPRRAAAAMREAWR